MRRREGALRLWDRFLRRRRLDLDSGVKVLHGDASAGSNLTKDGCSQRLLGGVAVDVVHSDVDGEVAVVFRVGGDVDVGDGLRSDRGANVGSSRQAKERVVFCDSRYARSVSWQRYPLSLPLAPEILLNSRSLFVRSPCVWNVTGNGSPSLMASDGPKKSTILAELLPRVARRDVMPMKVEKRIVVNSKL